MANNFKHKFYKKSQKDLEEILIYLSKCDDGKFLVNKFIDELKIAINILLEFPETGSLVKNALVSKTNVRRYILKNYIILYKFSNNTINIIRVIHKRQNYIKYN